MSESVELNLLFEAMYHLGQYLAQTSQEKSALYQRHLLRRGTQINDKQMLQQVLHQLELNVQEGDPDRMWGGPIAFQVKDSANHPWVAFGWDEQTNSYFVYSQDTKHTQDDLPAETRLSEDDPMPLLNRIVQQYGYFKSLATLLKSGYKIKGSLEQRSDGSQTISLQKNDAATDELQTVRLVFKPESGQTTILTDSRKPDGQHGVCPNIESILNAIGFHQYDKWTSPVAKQEHENSNAQADVVQSNVDESDSLNGLQPAAKNRQG